MWPQPRGCADYDRRRVTAGRSPGQALTVHEQVPRVADGSIPGSLEAETRKELRVLLHHSLEGVWVQIQRPKDGRRDLLRPDVARDLLVVQPGVRDEQRDARVVQRAAAVLGDLLAAARIDDAPVRLDEDVGRAGRGDWIARRRVTIDVSKFGAEVNV